MYRSVKTFQSVLLAVVVLAANIASAQMPKATLQISKVDPPNWWVAMPKPMLLVRGEGLHDASFSLSDTALHIEKTVVSENGHWAQLWLSASPATPKTIVLRASKGDAVATMPYSFEARRSASDGFAGFSSRDVLYLLMTDRFADGDPTNDGPHATSDANSPEAAAEREKPRGWHGGDLRGIAQHLDYLQQIGVTAVWPTPVYQNHKSDSYHGYGATDLYAVDEHYGSLTDLKSLATSLHARGMKLVLDTVPNHVGAENPWVTDEPAPDWFHGTKAHHLNAETNFRALIDPHAAERDRTGTLNGWFADVLPDMNTESPAVAQYLRQNAVWWIEETGADGLRIDTFPYVNREFWHDFNGELQQLYPHLTEVGEVFNGDPIITSSFAGGVTRAGVDTLLSTPFDFPTYFALRDVFGKGAPMSKLSDVLANDALYPHPERLVPFFGNHDTTRFMNVVKSPAAVRLAFAYIMTTRGMPQIYSGDELAILGGEDPDNRRDFPGGFGGSTANAFVANARTPAQQQTFEELTRLATVRRQHAALACGAEQVLSSSADWIVYLRDTAHAPVPCDGTSERVMIAIHRGPQPAKLNVNVAQTWLAGCELTKPELADSASAAAISSNALHLQLQGEDVLIAACR